MVFQVPRGDEAPFDVDQVVRAEDVNKPKLDCKRF